MYTDFLNLLKRENIKKELNYIDIHILFFFLTYILEQGNKIFKASQISNVECSYRLHYRCWEN